MAGTTYRVTHEERTVWAGYAGPDLETAWHAAMDLGMGAVLTAETTIELASGHEATVSEDFFVELDLDDRLVLVHGGGEEVSLEEMRAAYVG